MDVRDSHKKLLILTTSVGLAALVMSGINEMEYQKDLARQNPPDVPCSSKKPSFFDRYIRHRTYYGSHYGLK